MTLSKRCLTILLLLGDHILQLCDQYKINGVKKNQRISFLKTFSSGKYDVFVTKYFPIYIYFAYIQYKESLNLINFNY